MFLVVGGNSGIGAATVRRLKARGQRVFATTRRAGDLGADEAFLDVERFSDDWRPPDGVAAACICVAVTRLAACQDDWAGSSRINVTQTLTLAEKLLAKGVYTLFLSTNQVFDGTRAHVEADAPPSPSSAYGRQKAATEAVFKAWIADGALAGILRLAKVVSPDMALVRGWRRSLSRGEPVRAYRDMKMAPTPMALVAEAVACMLAERAPVVAQLAGPRDVAYDEAAFFVAERVGAARRLVSSVSAIDDGVAAGSTPLNTTLDSAYLAAQYGIAAPEPWAVIQSLVDA